MRNRVAQERKKSGEEKKRRMVVRLRLARFGRKKRPYYRIRAANARAPRDGKCLEEVRRYFFSGRDLEISRVAHAIFFLKIQLGTYDPIPSRVDNMREVRLNVERIKYWLAVGAQPSKRVSNLLAQARIIPPEVPTKAVQSAIPKSQRDKKKKRGRKFSTMAAVANVSSAAKDLKLPIPHPLTLESVITKRR